MFFEILPDAYSLPPSLSAPSLGDLGGPAHTFISWILTNTLGVETMPMTVSSVAPSSSSSANACAVW